MNDSVRSHAAPTADPNQKRLLTPKRLLISALIFGIAFAILFTNAGLGLNLTIGFVLVYIFAFINRELIFRKTFKQEPLIYLFSVPVLFLSISLFTSVTSLHVPSVAVILAVMFVQYLVLSGTALNRWDEGGFLLDIIFGGINRLLFGLGRFVGDGVGTLTRGKKKTGALVGVGIGLFLLLIVVPLLIIADPNMSIIFGAFFNNVVIGDVILYLFMFVLGASLITAPASTALEPEYTGPRKAVTMTARPAQPATTAVALSMVAVVYVLFACIQFGYFFAPRETLVSVLGLTSSSYAVKGFWELLFITCLNFGLVLLGLRFTKQNEGKTQPYLKVIYTLLIMFNFVILASSHLRMQCYLDAFGYSVARFISHSFMLFLVVLNALMLARIFCDRLRIVRLLVSSALLYLCIIVGINPESAVATANIERYEKTGKIDTEYLFVLSGDALVQACDFVTEYPEEFTKEVKDRAEYRLHDYAPTSWQATNLAHQRAHARLMALLNEG